MCYRIKTEIHIDKKPEEVWKALMDFPNYPKWNPFITSIKKVGDDELIAVMRSGNSEMSFKPRILIQEKNKELRWLGKLGGISGLFTGEHYFQLTPERDGTLFRQGENFSGIIAWLLLPFKYKEIRANFVSFNEALKALVEGE